MNHREDAMATELEYSLLMNSMDVSVSKHLLDEHFTVVWANNRYYEMFGYTKEEYEALYHNQCDLFYRDDPQDWQALVQYVTQEFSSGKTKYEYVCRMRHKSGKRLWIKLVGNQTQERINGYQVSYSVMMDITEQMQLQQEQTVTYSNIPGLIAKFRVTKQGFELINANQKYFEIFQGKRAFPFCELRKENGLASLVDMHPALRRGEPVCFQFSPATRGGKVAHMRVTGACVDWERGDPIYLLIYDDITQLTEQQELLRQQNAQLEQLAYGDMVTGGMNRMRFDMVTREAIARAPAGSYALVWLNVEKFKLINDMAGNESGDRTLKYMHGVMQAHLKQGEYLARITSDNYALLLHDAPDAAIAQRLNDMARDINSFNDSRRYKYIISFTAGVYRIDDAQMEITRIEDRANVARKGIRKNDATGLCACRFYSDTERRQLMAEKDIENKMRSALESGQFEVYLQPKLSLRDNTVCGAEALVRWNDPRQGMIMPDAFIPIFEKNGFITQMDLYVFEQVCKLLRGWIDQGFEAVPISVNVSRAHFTVPDFVEHYAQISRRYGVPPCLIELEVTETIVFEDPETFSQIVQTIHSKGFTCSMDDFGSGYSSMNVLKDIDVDTIKMDRAFFASPMMDNPKERDVVATVIELAKKLQMTALAEGVETEAQRLFLQKSACDLIQGYVFSKPLPAPDFARLVYGDGASEAAEK
nr:EAL domain-containing protein [Maliibacterium massiliense]